MVVSDEVFRWSVFGSNPFVPMGKFSSIVPVVTLGSISKGWSVPGWRTGWIALHDLDGVFKSKNVRSIFLHHSLNIYMNDLHIIIRYARTMFDIKSYQRSFLLTFAPNLVLYGQVLAAIKQFLDLNAKPPTVIQVRDFLIRALSVTRYKIKCYGLFQFLSII